jgi:zinc protease
MASLLPARGMQTTDAATAVSTNRPAATFDVTRLPNGMRVALRPVPDAGMVSFSLCLPGGLAFESPDNNGISTFTAAVMTKGTPRHDADSCAATLESLGASLDVTASREALCASADCLPGDSGTVAAMLADAVLVPTFPAQEVEKQRRLQLGAIRTRNDDWFAEGMLAFNRAFFGTHAYALPASGESNVVARLTRDDIAAFHRRLVQPSNMVIAVAGKFEPHAMRRLIETLFGGVTATAPPLPMCNRHVPPGTNSTAMVRTAREQAAVLVGYAGPAAGDPDRYAALVAEAAPRGFEGALFKALRGTTNLVYIATAVPVMELQAGAMVCLAQCEPATVPCVIATMTNVVATMAREPLSAARLARVKADVETAYCQRGQTLQGRTSLAALGEYRGLGANAFLDTPGKVGAVTADAVRAVAEQHFTTWTCVVTMPER